MANFKASVVFNETVVTPIIDLSNSPTFADNAAAIVGGLTIGQLYITPAGDPKVVI